MTLEDYILTHIEEEPDYLARVNRNTWLKQINPRMCSGHLQGRVLSMLSKMIQPQNILEILLPDTRHSALRSHLEKKDAWIP